MSDWTYTDNFPEATRLDLDHGIVAKVLIDQDPEHANPREWDQLGTMYCGHPDYNLGDEQLPRDGFADIDCPVCEGGERDLEGPWTGREGVGGGYITDPPVCARCENYYQVEPTLGEWLASVNAIAAMPLFLLDHSGITMRTGKFAWLGEDEITREDTASRNRFVGDEQGWDTSFIGFIITTRERCEELGVEIEAENIERQLEGEVSEYASYLEGDVYVFDIENAEGEHLDSCGGFIGIEHAQEAAKEAAEGCVEDAAKEIRRTAEWAARDVETV